MVPSPIPQLVANNGTAALHAAIADPGPYACEPKVDGVRGLIAYGPDGLLETRNRTGIRRDWRRGDGFTGHEKPRQALLDRAALLGGETGATVILFDRDADMDPLMSPLPLMAFDRCQSRRTRLRSYRLADGLGQSVRGARDGEIGVRLDRRANKPRAIGSPQNRKRPAAPRLDIGPVHPNGPMVERDGGP